MNTCCQIPIPPPPFDHSLQVDAERFSRYVGGGAPLNQIQTSNALTSALHLEMKLWIPDGQLPEAYHINDAPYNSWSAMKTRTTARADVYRRFNNEEQPPIFYKLANSFPSRSGCSLLTYDRWILGQIEGLRSHGLNQANLQEWHPVGGAMPPELGSIGLAQKLINIYIKYYFCWQIAGQFIDGHFEHVENYDAPFQLRKFLCALHAPIDRIVIEKVLCLPLGKYLSREAVLRSGKIRQSSDGSWRPWSKLDCLRTYYGFQLAFRKIAMSTWPVSCACSGSAENAIEECAKLFNEEFAAGPAGTGPDWIKVALEIPAPVIEETIDALSKTQEVLVEKKEVKNSLVKNRGPQTDSGMPAGKPTICIQEGPGTYLKIVDQCGDHWNLAMICLCQKHCHIWFKQRELGKRYLLGEIRTKDPDFEIQPLQAGVSPSCVGGTNYKGSSDCGSLAAAKILLDQYFDVRRCPKEE